MVRTLILTTVPCTNLDDALRHRVPEQSILAVNKIAEKETLFLMPSGSIKLTIDYPTDTTKEITMSTGITIKVTIDRSTDIIKTIEATIKSIFGWHCYFTDVSKASDKLDIWAGYYHSPRQRYPFALDRC